MGTCYLVDDFPSVLFQNEYVIDWLEHPPTHEEDPVSDPSQPNTARLSQHARHRCAEMHVNTKRVKRLLRSPDITRTSYNDRYLAVADSDPEIAVVYAKHADGTCTVITVLYRQYDTYIRPA